MIGFDGDAWQEWEGRLRHGCLVVGLLLVAAQAHADLSLYWLCLWPVWGCVGD